MLNTGRSQLLPRVQGCVGVGLKPLSMHVSISPRRSCEVRVYRIGDLHRATALNHIFIRRCSLCPRVLQVTFLVRPYWNLQFYNISVGFYWVNWKYPDGYLRHLYTYSYCRIKYLHPQSKTNNHKPTHKNTHTYIKHTYLCMYNFLYLTSHIHIHTICVCIQFCMWHRELLRFTSNL